MPPASTFWAVPPAWPDADALVCASGSSFVAADALLFTGARVVAVNDTARDLAAVGLVADVLYACDAKWWAEHWDAWAGAHPAPIKAGMADTGNGEFKSNLPPGVHALRHDLTAGFDPRPTHLATGKNSGHQALNLAAHLGARRVVLLGYDFAVGEDGREHYFGDHPAGLAATPDREPWIEHMAALAEALRSRGVEVVNASRRTALTCFGRATPEAAVQWLERPRVAA